ncbi:DUF6197 family protein [Streptomyces hoynatensis]|uniref:Uncharacterized protein n=1 Tax=Streptomyces hoynatensis TaxID=1141874 RepID=A0A3A9YI09_9ACTN|nr:hypothetical protein [Streptomyces hoynatensis]RKN36682.1 hypothetical protein D7294_29845 [Streptomyces hoynatensis]
MAPLTHTPAASRAAPEQNTPAAALDLETRLALTDAAMTLWLEETLLRAGIDAAHAETALSPADFSTEALTAYAARTRPARPLPDLYPTPVAAVLQRAARRLETDGWCRGATRDATGARCLYGALRAEARDRRQETAALDVLLEAIRRDVDPDAASVPAANDACISGPREAVRLLEAAAILADARGW